MQQTNTLIIGASIAGLASAACLKKRQIEYIIVEKESQIATPWRNHYHRLHLHTNKSLSSLSFKKYDQSIPRYPSRKQVVDYLEEYQKSFDIHPVFNCKVRSVKNDSGSWITESDDRKFESKNIIIATGSYGNPKSFSLKGIETFPGNILHSSGYKTGQDYREKKVLVIGFGNSACEIAMDLYEQGAIPSMSVRSPVNIIPRDILGIPVLRIGLWLSKLPPRIADALNAPLLGLLFGDLKKLGLRKLPYGVFEQIRRDRNIPLLDIGTVEHIRNGHIKIYENTEYVSGNSVHFANGTQADFDAIIAAIGYYPHFTEFLVIDEARAEDLMMSNGKQKYFGKNGLYSCGFWIGPTGVIREISLDAQAIAKHIALRKDGQS